MKGRSYAGTVIAIATILLTSAGRGHGQASAPPPVNDEILQHMHDLEQTVKELQMAWREIGAGIRAAKQPRQQHGCTSDCRAARSVSCGITRANFA
jgi:hypothetical protein